MNSNFDDYTIEALVWDEDFRSHIMQPTEQSKLRWQRFASSQPDGAEKLLAAATIIRALRIEEQPFADQDAALLVKETLGKVSFRELAVSNFETKQSIRPGYASGFSRWRLAAAAALLICIIGAAMWAQDSKVQDQFGSYEQLVKLAKEPLEEKYNGSAFPESVLLNDGSSIVLEPGARISFPRFSPENMSRVVYLSGDATFSIAHDPARPFFVHSNQLTTRVIGTVFRIHNNKKLGRASVEVLSGVVAVSSIARMNTLPQPPGNQTGSLILTRNQKVSFSGEENRLTTTIVDEPLLTGTPQNQFVEMPVKEVFEVLEKGYGIDIIYDERALHDVTFTANLTGRNLYQQVDIICKSVNARYEVTDGKIVIYALN